MNLLDSGIIGNGMIASEIKKSWQNPANYVIFASGVSDSLCTDSSQFAREKNLLSQIIEQLNDDRILVYFSTCSVFDASKIKISQYIQHKLAMESLVKKCESYQIFRLPQIIGISNSKKTLVSYFYEAITNTRKLIIQRNAIRNLLDVTDVVSLTSAICDSKKFINSTLNIASTRYDSVIRIVEILEKLIGQKALTKYIDGGSAYFIDTKIVEEFNKNLGIVFDAQYLPRVIQKYYGSC
jgi:nucleoside-diphosphate-sugar epimerase